MNIVVICNTAKRFFDQDFSFTHALLLSVGIHVVFFAALSITNLSSDAPSLVLDSAIGQARMQFSLPSRQSTINNNAIDTNNQNQADEDSQAEADVGLLTQEISNIAREIEYPALARKMGMQGIVVHQIKTDHNGKVVSITLTQSSGYDLLDKTATRHLEQWHFPFHDRTFKIPVRFVLQ